MKVNFGRFLEKTAPKPLGDIFSEKNTPNAENYGPNGELLPSLATLICCVLDAAF
jgi:hypothetical protein